MRKKKGDRKQVLTSLNPWIRVDRFGISSFRGTGKQNKKEEKPVYLGAIDDFSYSFLSFVVGFFFLLFRLIKGVSNFLI